MSKKLFIKSVGQIDDELLERFNEIDNRLSQKQSYKPLILKITAIAACFCVIIGSVLAAIYSESPEIPSVSDSKISTPNTSTPDTSAPDVSDDTISSGDNYVVGEDNSVFIDNYDKVINEPSSSGPSANKPDSLYSLYPNGMIVVAKVESFMPDTYVYPGDLTSKWGYRVLKLTVKEVIVGENVPNELYYLLHGSRDPDLREYDDIIFAFRQAGVGKMVLINREKKRVEAFENLVFDHIMQGSVIAYTDGKCDTSLFDKKGFVGDKYFLEHSMQGDIENEYDCPIKQKNSLEVTIEKLKEFVNLLSDTYDNQQQRFTLKSDFTVDGADEAFEYVEPFENGYFAQHEFSVDSTSFVRIINGFFTNEKIFVSTLESEGVVDSGVRFSNDDIKNAPDIGRFMKNFNFDSLIPSHTENASSLELGSRRVSGKYVKNGDAVYGVVRIYWTLWCNDDEYVEDDAYYVVNPDGSATLYERDELKALIGDDGIIRKFNYNEPTPVFYA